VFFLQQALFHRIDLGTCFDALALADGEGLGGGLQLRLDNRKALLGLAQARSIFSAKPA
jgi:hypothetical protein